MYWKKERKKYASFWHGKKRFKSSGPVEVENWTLYFKRTWHTVLAPIVYAWSADTFDLAEKTCIKRHTLNKKYENRGYLVVLHSILIGRWLNIFRLLGKRKKYVRRICLFFSWEWSPNQMFINCIYRITRTQFENAAWSIRLWKDGTRILSLPFSKHNSIHVKC